MKVKELIERLQEFDPEADVRLFRKNRLIDDDLCDVLEVVDDENTHTLYVVMFSEEAAELLQRASEVF